MLFRSDPNNRWLHRFAIERYLALGYLDYADQQIYKLQQLDNTVVMTRYLRGALAETAGALGGKLEGVGVGGGGGAGGFVFDMKAALAGLEVGLGAA